MSDPNKEWLSEIAKLCADKIKQGDNNSVYHAVVMMYAKLCEMELSYSVVKQSVDSLDKQLQNTVTSTYHTLITPTEETNYEGEELTTSIEGISGESESFNQGNI